MKLRRKTGTAEASAPAVEQAPSAPAQEMARPRPENGGSEKLRGVRMDDVRKPKFDEFGPASLRRGPATGRGMSDADFLATAASAEELQVFRAAVQARRARETKVWLCCNRGCGLAIETRPDRVGVRCPNCNLPGRQDLGHLRRMTTQEITAYVAWKAGNDKRRETQFAAAGLARRNEERLKAGLPTFSLEEYRAEVNDIYQQKVRREAQLGAISPAAGKAPLEGLSDKELAEVRASLARSRGERPQER